MKRRYGTEVIELLEDARQQNRSWKIGQVIAALRERGAIAAAANVHAVRKLVYRVLEDLVALGLVLKRPPTLRGGYTMYRWRGPVAALRPLQQTRFVVSED